MIFGQLFLLCFLISLYISYKLFRLRRSDVGQTLTIIGVLTAFWLLMEGLSYYVSTPAVIVFYQMVKYISIILIPPTIFVVSYLFMWQLNRKRVAFLALFFIVPIMSLLSLITYTFPYPFIYNPGALVMNQVPMFVYERAIGFYIHSGYSYVILLINSGLLLYRAYKLPRFYRF